MKIKRLKTTLSALVIMALTFSACSGEDGDQGPKGESGNDGVDGRDGRDGVDGNDGSANVQSSNYTVLIADWSTGAVLRDTLIVPAITQEVLDEGTIQVFQKMMDTTITTWSNMPFSYVALLAGNPVTITFQFAYNFGEVYLTATNSLGLSPTPNAVFPGDREFKVIVIPPAALVQGVDVNDYEQLKIVYGIQEFDM